MWQRPDVHLINIFSPLYFFQVVVDVFQNQRQLQKKQEQSAANREGNGANQKGDPENQARFPQQGKNCIIKCKTEVSSTLRESSGWFCDGKVFKRRRYETHQNCEFYKTKMRRVCSVVMVPPKGREAKGECCLS